MTLSSAILFPQAMLPLYIFEPRYRQMLRDSLRSHRMLSVALKKPGRVREIPSSIAGVGLIRVSVANKDGASHLILQGLARVQLNKATQYRPYRVHRIEPIETIGGNEAQVRRLTKRITGLVAERVDHGASFPPHALKQFGELADVELESLGLASLKELVARLASNHNADHLADLIACTCLSNPLERQTILETVNLEERLKILIQLLVAENARVRKKKNKDL